MVIFKTFKLLLLVYGLHIDLKKKNQSDSLSIKLAASRTQPNNQTELPFSLRHFDTEVHNQTTLSLPETFIVRTCASLKQKTIKGNRKVIIMPEKAMS